MRWLSLVWIAGLCGFSSCATRADSIRAYGPVWMVSPDDIRAAVAADRAAPRKHDEKAIDYVEVVGSNTIWVHHEPTGASYCEVKRVKGRWRYIQSWLYIE